MTTRKKLGRPATGRTGTVHSVYIKKELKARIDHLCAERLLSVSEAICLLIADTLDKVRPESEGL
jgi:hypothetical protein